MDEAGQGIANPECVVAPLNFAANRSNGGIWCNDDPSRITMELTAKPVELTDARSLPHPPSLDREGFELHRLPFDEYDFETEQWIYEVYNPRSLDLIQKLTGAPFVATLYNGLVMFRDTGTNEPAPAAEFVHIDQTRDAIAPFIEMAADETTRRRYPRVQLFNLWRVMTPPPQDVPLALCDQRTVFEDDWVFGKTVHGGETEGVPLTTSVYNPAQKWYYFSDVTPDDVIVFKANDTQRNVPMGCLHGAFRHPGNMAGAIPRASSELRIFAFSEK